MKWFLWTNGRLVGCVSRVEAETWLRLDDPDRMLNAISPVIQPGDSRHRTHYPNEDECVICAELVDDRVVRPVTA